jgi:hypothetical protein
VPLLIKKSIAIERNLYFIKRIAVQELIPTNQQNAMKVYSFENMERSFLRHSCSSNEISGNESQRPYKSHI